MNILLDMNSLLDYFAFKGTTKELKHINMKVIEQTSCGTLADDQLCAIADTGYGDVCQVRYLSLT